MKNKYLLSLVIGLVVASPAAHGQWIEDDESDVIIVPRVQEILECRNEVVEVSGDSVNLMGVLLEAPASEDERWWVDREITRCRRKVSSVANPYDVLAVLRLEDALAIPRDARGILGAVWCIESAMRTVSRDGGPIRGDWTGGVAHAYGPAQLWTWHRSWCGLSTDGADDLLSSLTCYWQRVEDRRRAALERGGGTVCEGDLDEWRIGEALTANGPFYKKQGCAAISAHWSEMLEWNMNEVGYPE